MFLFKCCKKVVASQFISHMRENKLERSSNLLIKWAIALNQHCCECITMCYVHWMMEGVWCWYCWTCRRRSTQWIMASYYRVSRSALVFRALPTFGLSLTSPVVHSSSKSEILVLLIVNWPAVFPRGPCWAQSYTWCIPLLSELSCVTTVSGFTCTRTTLNCNLAWRPLKWRMLCLRALGLKFVCVSWTNGCF